MISNGRSLLSDRVNSGGRPGRKLGPVRGWVVAHLPRPLRPEIRKCTPRLAVPAEALVEAGQLPLRRVFLTPAGNLPAAVSPGGRESCLVRISSGHDSLYLLMSLQR